MPYSIDSPISTQVQVEASQPRPQLVMVMLMIVVAQSSMALIFPALPIIGDSLQVSDGTVRWLVSAFLVGMGASQLFYGPWSDSAGRRPTLLFGLFLGCLGSTLCCLADDFNLLLIGRALVGAGIGALPVLARSCLRDSYDGVELTRVIGILSMVAALSPMLSPLVGGGITAAWGWHILLILFSAGMWAVFFIYLFFFQESHHRARQSISLFSVLINYRALILDHYFLTRFSGQVIVYLMLMLNLALAPFLLQVTLGLSVAEYSVLMVLPAIGIFIGGGLRRHLPKSHTLTVMVWLLWLVGGIALVFLPLSVPLYLIAIWCLMISYGAIYPIIISSLLQPFQHLSGTAAALAGALQFSIAGSLGGWLSRYLVTDAPSLGVAYVVGAIIMGGILLSWRYVRFSKVG